MILIEVFNFFFRSADVNSVSTCLSVNIPCNIEDILELRVVINTNLNELDFNPETMEFIFSSITSHNSFNKGYIPK